MLRAIAILLSFLILSFAVPGARAAEPVRIAKVIGGLTEPWGIGHLPDGSFLVTERGGRLLFVQEGKATRVAGVPEVFSRGQGGLLDVSVARDFASSREIFLTYAHPQQGGASTALAVARLAANGTRLEKVQQVFLARPASSAGHHFGSRVVEAADGKLFVTLGDRGQGPLAQDLGTHNGAIIRVNRDGTVPDSNPFVGQPGALPEIWTYGHRNVQGAGLDLEGNLIAVEHGAKGGDEVNRVRKGANYGWPVISYGVNYNGSKIGEGTAKPGMEQPALFWDPSIAPSGLMVYSGRLWPEWRGDIFVGSLKFDYISRLDGNPLREAGQLRGPETERVRDVVEAPDGSIWFLSVDQGAVYRMTPG